MSNPQAGGCTANFPFEPGVDIADGGRGYGYTNEICTTPRPLADSLGPGHGHGDFENQYDTGNMDKVCWNGTVINPACYAYVYQTDVQPYFDIATNYGFANYMFQTNEGPSFEAHQFLFTGTSAAVAPNDPNKFYLDFVSENAVISDSGCPAGQTTFPDWVHPTGKDFGDPRPNPSECYTHDSLVTAASDCVNGKNCDKGFSWAYYAPTEGTIWDAPAAIPQVCYGEEASLGTACGGSEWNNHVFLETQGNGAPIFDALLNCTLPQITWVIPDAAWSDHAGLTGRYGPS